MAHRFSGPGGPFEGLTRLTSRGPRWTGMARFVPEMLGQPLRWKKPRRIFVSSMSDLFHDDITNEQIAAVFGIMGACHQHTFQVLTKRPERMKAWFDWVREKADGQEYGLLHDACGQLAHIVDPGDRDIDQAPSRFDEAMEALMGAEWPLPNVWLGVSVENQDALKRVYDLIACPAVVRFASVEPLLGEVRFPAFTLGAGGFCKGDCQCAVKVDEDGCCVTCGGDAYWYGLDWVIVGGESGPGARPCDVAWIRSIVEQCRDAGTRVFVKQLGAFPHHEQDGAGWAFDAINGGDRHWRWDEVRERADGTPPMHVFAQRDRKGGDPSEWPEDLRVRQFPEAT